MIFSEQWIREWVAHDLAPSELMERLTMAGLEVDAHQAVAYDFDNVVVAEVTQVAAHPDADKLSVCTVSDGETTVQVVCGAPDVRVGMKAPLAKVGAQIHDKPGKKPFVIKQAKLRGVESAGMLCATDELGLLTARAPKEKAPGLMELPADAPVGENLRDYLRLNDTSIELDLTPNRGDCLGIAGLAREIGVLARQDVKPPAMPAVKPVIDDTFPVSITAADGCPRYLGRVVRRINLNAATPLWMQEKLRRCGLRSIDPVVDVTNYVLLELGQPLHAFDLNKLKGGIDVRLARAGEKLTLLDEKEVDLTPDTLLITDETGPVAMAGIMGGLGTAVDKTTRDVFLECAFFSPLAIAGRARAYGLHTDASHRYERGVDHGIQHRAMERATALLLEIAGGESGPVTEATGTIPARREVVLRTGSIRRLLGIDIPIYDVLEILERLGFALSHSGGEIRVGVPPFRFDVSLEADLIEELARIYGYNKLPKSGGLGEQALTAQPEAVVPLNQLRQHLVALGYQEVITYSFIEPTLAAKLGSEHSGEPITLQNPISADMAVMRGSLLPGLISALKHNANRQQTRLRLFESGLVFLKPGEGEGADQWARTQQPARIAGLICGRKNPENWNQNKQLVDFYDVKGDVEALLALGGETAAYRFEPAESAPYQTGQCARVTREGETVGYLGALHPATRRELELDSPVFLFELALEPLTRRRLPRSHELSRYPEVGRDLAVVVENAVPATDILAAVRENAGEHLNSLRIFDVYQGDAVGKNKKSVALGLTWQHPSRTLSDEEINSIILKCVNALEQQFNAVLRS
ncbi:MAG: phenylalanine--tRNA ligase subunit beta [Pseudohongiellaceae bacterium]